jgi:hypothetical protein
MIKMTCFTQLASRLQGVINDMLHIVYKLPLRIVAEPQFPPQSGEKKGSDPCTTQGSGQAAVLPPQSDGKKGLDLVPLREVARQQLS